MAEHHLKGRSNFKVNKNTYLNISLFKILGTKQSSVRSGLFLIYTKKTGTMPDIYTPENYSEC